jgi:hypothetical protein
MAGVKRETLQTVPWADVQSESFQTRRYLYRWRLEKECLPGKHFIEN